jgi:voltage-gated potassium channel Kch
LLGFCWTASSLLEEITREQPALLGELVVVDFNPQVIEQLRRRSIRVVYGDISQRETLLHAGVAQAAVIICSLPDTLLKGMNNRKLLTLLRELNPQAQIIVPAERLADLPRLYAAGAAYVSVPRVLEARDLWQALTAAHEGRLDKKRQDQAAQLVERQEVVA